MIALDSSVRASFSAANFSAANFSAANFSAANFSAVAISDSRILLPNSPFLFSHA
ncbi:MAG TPA: hypothetical protein DEQ66_08785 [Prevotella sp.]|nr:hypothetical protein [Prevotella sp.]